MHAAHRTLLVVEDDADCRAALSEALSDEGYRLTFACDGAEALRQLTRELPLPDVILLDLAMPNMTGWQFRDLQKRRPELADIPVVVMTASNPLGIDAAKVLQKPFDMSELVHWVRRLVE
jgi:CheY-like chemotaxis protein